MSATCLPAAADTHAQKLHTLQSVQCVPVETIKSEQVDATPRFYFHLNRTTPAADIFSLFLFDGANLLSGTGSPRPDEKTGCGSASALATPLTPQIEEKSQSCCQRASESFLLSPCFAEV